MEDCGCLCGCDHAPVKPVDPTALPIPVTKTSKKGSRVIQDLKIAEYVRVYILGDGTKGRVIEEFAGQTGYHIRTIPQGRFQNPVAVAAGGGYLAIVDRFGAGDVIRVTDKYAGAGPGGFDEDGFPLDSVNWGGLADIAQIPVGGFVSGLQILPRGTLIGTVNRGDGVPTFVSWDVDGTFSPYNAVFSVPAPYTASGDAVGLPCPVDQAQAQWVHEFIATLNSAQGPALIKVDFLQRKVTGLMGLPNGTPYGVSNAGGVISVMMGDATGVTDVYRLERLDNNTFMGGIHSDRLVPKPTSAGITKTFTQQDIPGNPADESYYDIVGKLNRRFNPGTFSSREEAVADPAIALGGRPIDATTTAAKNDNRAAVETTYTTDHYLIPYVVPCQRITNPKGGAFPTIKDMDVVHNTLGEMTLYTANGAPDSAKPLFRLIHGTHYDYLSDGGYVYGCRADGSDTVVPITSGLAAVSMAIDKSTEPGKLKELPDLKVALVDTKTGLMVYGSTKSLGYKWWGGVMAGIRIADTAADGLKRTGCSDEADSLLSAYDGIKYTQDALGKVSEITKDSDTPISFETDNDGRRPWNLFIPRVTTGKVAVQPYDSRPVPTKGSDGGFLDWWIDTATKQKSPITEIGRKSQMFYPKNSTNTRNPIFITSCGAGFFGLNWQKQRVDGPLDGQGHPTVSFVTPDSVLNFVMGPLDLTVATEADTPENVPKGLSAGLTPFTVAPGLGEHPELTRAAIFDTDIRSWIGIEIDLERGDTISDGVASWTQPEAFENGLGVPVGKSAYNADEEAVICASGEHPIGAFPGSAYDSGDIAGDGSAGIWQIDVFANGKPINSISTEVSFPEQIQYLAPAEAQDILNSTFNAEGTASPFGHHKGHVYFSREVVTEITIRCRLVNYAFAVYRVGFHTISFAADDHMGGASLCPGKDPGFNAGNNCEAACCGNVACASQVLFGNKLFASDPVRPVVVNTLWEGSTTFRIAHNPYKDLGIGVGTLFNAFLSFDLNGPMSGWTINLRTGSSQ